MLDGGYRSPARISLHSSPKYNVDCNSGLANGRTRHVLICWPSGFLGMVSRVPPAQLTIGVEKHERAPLCDPREVSASHSLLHSGE